MNYLRNFLHFRLILPLQRYVIIIIFAVARNILQHLDERRELYTLVGRNAAGFKNHQVGNWLKKLVELEILALPDDKIDLGIACLVMAKDAYPELDINAFDKALDAWNRGQLLFPGNRLSANR